MTGKEITNALDWDLRRRNLGLVLCNAYFYFGEMDVFCLRNSGITVEYEIKISRADFKADFKKIDKHKALANKDTKAPNRFVYVCPEGLIKKEETPIYAGLIYITERLKFKEIIAPPLIHRNRLFNNLIAMRELMQKCYHRYQNERNKH